MVIIYLPLQIFFAAVGSCKGQEYSISEETKEFIDSNSTVFQTNSIGSDGSNVIDVFRYNEFSKNPKNYKVSLVSATNLCVKQIFEETYWGGDHTFIIAEDYNDNVYYINLSGFADNIYEGSTINLTALPLDFFTYPNVEGTAIWAVVFAGVSVT